ncbi:MAG: hypothetical protein IKY10_00495 [Clostridia bacterium]|nr:hypothetical protein [Clostridia bacterium]
MENKYKVFQKGFHKVLDLVETADVYAIKDYERLVGNLPGDVLIEMFKCEDFVIDNEKYNADMVRLVNELSFEFVTNKKFSQTEMTIHRVFEEDLYKDEVYVRLFSYSFRNTSKKQEPMQVFYEEKDGKYNYTGNNKENNSFDLNCEVYLERIDDDFYLRSVRTICGWEIYDKRIPVTFDEIIQCVEDEDEYADDLEMELDFEV